MIRFADNHVDKHWPKRHTYATVVLDSLSIVTGRSKNVIIPIPGATAGDFLYVRICYDTILRYLDPYLRYGSHLLRPWDIM